MELSELLAIAAEVLDVSTDDVHEHVDRDAAEAARLRADGVPGALLWELVRSRPFAIGNDRIAVLAALELAAADGAELDLEPPEEIVRLISGIRSGDVGREETLRRIEKRTARLRVVSGGGGLDAAEFKRRYEAIVANVKQLVHGKDDVVRLVTMAMLANGHVLFNDVPGTGGTMLARALGQSIGGTSARLECSAATTLGDLIGSPIGSGPLFANVVRVDQLNRADWRLQMALVEAMAEQRVVSQATSYPFPSPWIVMASQHPAELESTNPLSYEHQDRFLFRMTIGLPSREAEQAIMRMASGSTLPELSSVVSLRDVEEMREFALSVDMPVATEEYILELVATARRNTMLATPPSPRCSIALARTARVCAACAGRSSASPEDVRAALGPVMLHRMELSPSALSSGATSFQVLHDIVATTKAPLRVAEPKGASPAKGPACPKCGGGAHGWRRSVVDVEGQSGATPLEVVWCDSCGGIVGLVRPAD